jgi:hypothetical protein
MPQLGISSDWLADREDDIARLIEAKDKHLYGVRVLAELLHKRGHITPAYYSDLCDSLDAIGTALLVGKHNTARLRNWGEREL